MSISPETLSQALRDATARLYQTGKPEDLTIRNIRAEAEKQLGLETGYFKQAPGWHDKSKSLIREEVEAQEAQKTRGTQETQEGEEEKEEEDEDDKKSAPTGAKKRQFKTQAQDGGESKARKRTKKVQSGKEVKSKGASKARGKGKGRAKGDDLMPEQSEDEESTTTTSEKEDLKEKGTSPDRTAEREDVPKKSSHTKDADLGTSDSELSSLPDGEEPIEPESEPEPQAEPEKPVNKENKARKRGRPPSSSSAPRRNSGGKAKQATEQDPDAAMIKKLQSQLTQCGVRKMWYRELQPYETPKQKIAHLKDLLRDVGMTGRFSQEKAKMIREQRELQEDLKEIQANASVQEDEDDGEDRRKQRNAARRQMFAFLSDDDNGEESE